MRDVLQSDSSFIRKLSDIVLANLEKENFGVSELAGFSGMSSSRLNRHLRKTCGKSVNQFIREIRLLKALEMLQNKTVTASEVSYKVGFSSPAYFNKCFHAFFGYPPGKIRNGTLINLEKPIDQVISKQQKKRPSWLVFSRPWKLSLAFIIIMLVLVVLFGIINRTAIDDHKSANRRNSIAVMPFRNMTNDTTWNIWQGAIQTSLISYLTNSEELIVRQSEPINILLRGKGLTEYASITPELSGGVSKKLNASQYISGSIIEAGSEIRVDAQVFDTRKGDVLRSFKIQRPAREEMIFEIVDTLSERIKNFLVISNLKKEEPKSVRPNPIPDLNPKAYRYIQYGDRAFEKHDYKTSLEMYLHAFRIDSTMKGLYFKIAGSYLNQDRYPEGKDWLLKWYNKRDMNDILENINANYHYSFYFMTPDSAIKYARRMIDLDDKNPRGYFNVGDCYWMMEQYEKAIPYFEKVLEIYNKWGLKPDRVYFYTYPGIAYHRTGQYKKEKKLYKKSQRDYPDDWALTDQYAVLAFSLGDTVEGEKWMRKFISAKRDLGISESRINVSMAYFSAEQGDLEKAEEYMCKALLLEPENPDRINQLAYFLIDKERNIHQGLELIGKALEIRPDNYVYLDTKGWGLHKLGKYREALETLQKSWDLRMKNAIYYHPAAYHLEVAKKAVSGDK